MATKATRRRAKAARRRAARRKGHSRSPAQPRDVRVERVRTARPGHIEDTRSTELTDKERRSLLKQAEALTGRVDLAYMGVRVLELRFCGWSVENFLADPYAETMSKPARAAWADQQFREAEAWWSGLHYESRAQIVKMTRECSSEDPIALGTGTDPFPARERRVWSFG